MLVFGSVFEFIRGSWPRLLPSSLGLRRTRQQLPTLPPRLLWPFFQQRSFHGFPMGFPMVGGGGAERTSFYRVVFEENEINTLDHTWKGWKWSSGETKSECFVNMDMWVETEKPRKFSPPQKKVSHHSDEPRLVESPRFVESVRFFVVLESVHTTHHLICATCKLC